jgi:LPXTG-motif cell wall-anchored protein
MTTGKRLALPAAIVLAMTGLAAPARADTGTPEVAVEVPEQVTVIEGHTKSVTATVANVGTGTAKDVVLTFGSTRHPVDPSVGLTLPAGCDAHACTVGDLAPGAKKRYTFTLTPASGSDLTSTFDITVGGAGGAVDFDAPLSVVRAKAGVDIEVAPIDDMKLGRGQSADVPVVVHNAGSEDVSGIGVFLLVQSGLQALGAYRNCEVDSDADLGMVVCLFDQKLPAGSTFTVPSATPIKVKVASDAGGPYAYNAAVIAVGVTAGDLSSAAAKSGPTLRLQSVKSVEAAGDDDDDDGDLNPDDNLTDFTVTVGRSAADSAAVGASFSGAVGDTKTVKVGVRNLGPTGIIPPSLQWIQTVRVTIPSGIDLTKVDELCAPGAVTSVFDIEDTGVVDGRVYTCFVVTRLGKGDTATFSFTGTIADGTHGTGSVVVDGGVQDTDAANDKAGITVKLTADGEGGGLPVTGAPAAWLALGGAVLLLLGAAAFGLARRRRIVTQAD